MAHLCNRPPKGTKTGKEQDLAGAWMDDRLACTVQLCGQLARPVGFIEAVGQGNLGEVVGRAALQRGGEHPLVPRHVKTGAPGGHLLTERLIKGSIHSGQSFFSVSLFLSFTAALRASMALSTIALTAGWYT